MEIKIQEILDYLVYYSVKNNDLDIPYEKLNHPFDNDEFDVNLEKLQKTGDIEIIKYEYLGGGNCIIRIKSNGKMNSKNQYYKKLSEEQYEKIKNQEKLDKRKEKLEKSTIHKNRIYIWAFYLSLILNLILILLRIFKI